MTKTVTVKVAQSGPPAGKNVSCDLRGPGVVDNALFLDRDEDYDITFELDAGGPLTWGPNPFGNAKGQCPPDNPACGPRPPISVHGKRSTPTSITIHMDRQSDRTVEHFRMNFNGGLTCDPIIVVP